MTAIHDVSLFLKVAHPAKECQSAVAQLMTCGDILKSNVYLASNQLIYNSISDTPYCFQYESFFFWFVSGVPASVSLLTLHGWIYIQA